MTENGRRRLVLEHTPRGLLGRRDHLTFRGNVKQGRHGWLRLTPAYSLHVVQEILQDCRPDEFVLEPFSGTGTTLLAAAELGIPCHAVDVNPFLVWLGNLKVTSFSNNIAEELTTTGKEIITSLRGRRELPSGWVPDISNIEKWWDKPNLARLVSHFGACSNPCGVLRLAFRPALLGRRASYGVY